MTQEIREEQKTKTGISITIHRALSELKLINKRIASGLTQQVIGSKVKIDAEVLGMTAVDFEAKLVGNLQSVRKLIENKSKLKAAIEKSNAETLVKINGKEMTVTEALTIKNHTLKDLNDLYTTLKRLHFSFNDNVNRLNTDIKAKADQYALSMFQGVSSISPEKVANVKSEYITSREYEVVDPNKLPEVIETIEKEIDGFTNEIDYVLSESNAKATITIEL